MAAVAGIGAGAYRAPPPSHPREIPVTSTVPLRLRTLGGLSLERNGTPATGAGARRKPLALLAALAASPRGVSRDKLALLLWPEADAEGARSVLRQTLYTLRRDLEAPDLVVGATELRLNPEVIATDLAELEDALARGDAARAVALYHGPFLDGFHLGDAPEFERFQDAERDRIAARVRAALESLAGDADRRVDAGEAARWWARLAELDPLSTRPALGLMRALAASGDAARAVRHARAHAEALAREVGAPPDPAVVRLAEMLRAALARQPAPATPAAPPAARTEAEPPEAAQAEAAQAEAARTEAAREAPPPTAVPPAGELVDAPPIGPAKRRRSAALLLAGLGAASVALLALVMQPGRDEGAGPESLPVSDRLVAVLPFAHRGADADSVRSEGLMELLATDLDLGDALRAADPRAVLAVLRRAGGAGDGPSAPAVARAVGAGRWVTGEVVDVGGRVRITAEMRRALPGGRDTVLAAASADGVREELFLLVDRLAVRLLARELASGGALPERVAEHATDSLDALKDFLAGTHAYRRGEYARAAELLVRATERDTGFALAHYRLASASEWNIQYDRARVAVERALAHGDRLGARERLLAEALAAYLRGEGRRAEALYQQLVSRHPEDAEAWFRLAEVQFHYFAVRDRPISASRQAWLNVARWDPDHVGVIVHLARIAAFEGDTAALDTLVARARRASPAGDRLWELRGYQAYVRNADGTTRALEAAFEREVLAAGDSAVLTATGATAYARNDAARRRLARSLASSGNPEMRKVALIMLADAEAWRGRPLAADSALRALATLDAPAALVHRAWLATLPTLTAPPPRLDSLARALESWSGDPPSPASGTRDQAFWTLRDVYPHLRLYLLGRIAARLGRWQEVARHEAQLRALGGPSHARVLGADLGRSLGSERALHLGDTATAAALLDSARVEVPVEVLNSSVFWGQTAEQFQRGRLAWRRGRPDAALGALGAAASWGWIDAAASLESAEIHRAAGRPGDAARLYRSVIARWSDAEPAQRVLVERARERLAQMAPSR